MLYVKYFFFWCCLLYLLYGLFVCVFWILVFCFLWVLLLLCCFLWLCFLDIVWVDIVVIGFWCKVFNWCFDNLDVLYMFIYLMSVKFVFCKSFVLYVLFDILYIILFWISDFFKFLNLYCNVLFFKFVI